MQSIKRIMWGSKKRKAGLAAVVTLAVAGAAIAYVLTTFTGSVDGQSSQPLPNQAASKDVSGELVYHDGNDGTGGSNFNAGALQVGGSVPYDLDLNTSAPDGPGVVKGVTQTVTVDAAHVANCPESDFHISNTYDGTSTYPISVAANPNGTNPPQTIAIGQVSLSSDPGVNQAGCSGATITLHATLTP